MRIVEETDALLEKGNRYSKKLKAARDGMNIIKK